MPISLPLAWLLGLCTRFLGMGFKCRASHTELLRMIVCSPFLRPRLSSLSLPHLRHLFQMLLNLLSPSRCSHVLTLALF
ncbi:hypothetical protein LINPERPRIM_LOCUS8480 [Linum perenne]